MNEQRLRDLTVEHIGPDATDDDLELFKHWCETLMTRDGMTEADAISALWGQSGDYLANSAALGLDI